MPSFAFWKSSKPDESKSPLLSDAAVAKELSAIVPGASNTVDLNPGNQDSGVFFFDEDAQEFPLDHHTPIIEPTTVSTCEIIPEQCSHIEQHSLDNSSDVKMAYLDINEPSPRLQTPTLVPEQPSFTHNDDSSEHLTGDYESAMKPESTVGVSQQIKDLPTEPTWTEENFVAANTTHEEEQPSSLLSQPASLVPMESGNNLSVKKRSAPAVLGEIRQIHVHDRDSGVYTSDTESSPISLRSDSTALSENAVGRSRVLSLSKPAAASPQRTNSIARLQRPAELNLGFNSAPDSAKPRSELDLRYDLIRNSKTQSKAALRSPTQLLQDRLNMSPKKKDVEEKARVFTPPRATINGCMLPGPGAQAEAFISTSVRARTEAGGRPAWWCKFDKLVIFDGSEQQGNGEIRMKTRTSKGLSIARRLGDLETVVIPLGCSHCHEMLNRHEWKYDMRVCNRSVCWDCKQRCKWELAQEKTSATTPTTRTDANRERADSMLQDEQSRDYSLTKEVAV